MTNKKTRLKSSAVEHWVPVTREEAAEGIRELGFHQGERARLQATMNDALQKVRADFDADARPHAERIEELMLGLKLFCEARRDELTKGGRVKTFAFATGEVSWRLRPTSIVIRGADKLLEWLAANGLERFIRTKREPDKDALGRERELAATLPGVSLSQREDFIVAPFESKLEEVQS
jgi:phage host-nuclease inhibitor protein Gam